MNRLLTPAWTKKELVQKKQENRVPCITGCGRTVSAKAAHWGYLKCLYCKDREYLEKGDLASLRCALDNRKKYKYAPTYEVIGLIKEVEKNKNYSKSI